MIFKLVNVLVCGNTLYPSVIQFVIFPALILVRLTWVSTQPFQRFWLSGNTEIYGHWHRQVV